MKHTLLLIVGLAFCAPLALNAQTSATTTTSSTTTTTAPMKKIGYRGTVKSVDTAGNTITVTNKKDGDMTLTVTTTTKILQDRKPATLADITMGEKVSGSYTKDASGAMTAASIHGHSVPAAPAMTTSSTSSSTTTTSTNAAPSTP